MARESRLQRRSKYEGMMEGIKAVWSSSSTYRIGGKLYSKDEIVGRLQSVLDAMRETSSLRAAWLSQVAVQRKREQDMRDFVRYLEAAVRSEHGEHAKKLAAFGLEPTKKKGPRKARDKALAAEKAKATRQARGTLGRRQRLKIKGVK